MTKKLNEMSIEELWQLFPIFLVKHNEKWKSWFDIEKKIILSIIPSDIEIRISHIGSTAVPNIYAKNIVDILLEVNNLEEIQNVKKVLVDNGYILMSEEEVRVSLNKGYTENGFAEKVFHLHIRLFGDNDELYFRDYLIENPDVARAYEELKLSLWKKYEHDRDGYTNAKGEFIKKNTQIAKEVYKVKY